MKVLQINTTFKNGGSTGRIAYDLKSIQEQFGIESYAAYGYEFKPINEPNTLKMESVLELKWNILKTRLFAHHGFYNVAATKRLLKYMDQIKPDIVHLHNIHNHYVNVKMLFDYIKLHNISVVWTLHDCWSFTGWCAYFDYVNCDKWKKKCYNCPSRGDYPFTWFIDRSKENYIEKKACFCGVKNLILVTPSQWLADLTRYSFLKEYRVKVINNGIDTKVFKPSTTDIRIKYSIPEDCHVIIAVMNMWGKRKGIDYLLKLPSALNYDECLVIVGLKKSYLKQLPTERCIGICHTNNADELAALYSTADVFINPTLEDNFPTTNIEAIACGTPVITFRTGGSVESVDELTGSVVDKADFAGLVESIHNIIYQGKDKFSTHCVEKAVHQYNKSTQYLKYIALYYDLLNNIKK